MFRTELTPPPSANNLSHDDLCISLGSCFAQMVGHRLKDYKFHSETNPLGILFNPVSLHLQMLWALTGTPPSMDRTALLHDRYVHYDFHSDIHADNREKLSDKVGLGLSALRENLVNARWVILTYGTAVVHTLDSQIVANCHKQPSHLFERDIVSVSTMRETALKSLNLLKSLNPEVRVILTVSPVRHIRDTLPVNGVSKARLRTLCHELSEELKWAEYFPSYEILMDDLRDYRFYSEDLIHPNKMAEDYIWQKFGGRYFSPDTQSINIRWDALKKSLAHRPFNPNSSDHQKFLRDTLAKLEHLAQDLPLSKEITALKTQLHNA